MKKILIATLSSLLVGACTVGQREKIAISTSSRPSDYSNTNYDIYDDIYGSDDITTETTNTSTTTTTVSDNGQTQTQQVETFNQTTTVETNTQTPNNVDVSKTAFNAMGNYKIGNPYLIDGVSYYPHEDYTYSEIGMASWYGPDFHGGTTSNGEVFDETKLTAAHRTLPMPSLVRVTNLENGISATVKVNDRGPYARDRILDLSSAAADVLGIKQKGTARVKVEILPEESKHLKELAIASQNTDIYPANVEYPTRQVQPVPTPAPAPVEIAPISQAKSTGNTTVPSSAVAGDYFVQVAAYSTYDKAEAMKDKLSHLGTVKIFKAVVNGNTLYKVRLGEFKTKEDAERVQEAVSNAGISGSRVILKEDGGFKWKV
ncbi:septal ring lytic transglycosylase RlpA family protein [bacterium]|nr:septal ring lytic transglycosylase RlpA family protein [bacterium]